ncbi:MAG TPA: hypothetical protein VGG92_08300 [Caulobacteraceae bacterium]|jgi:hypothetical protein
MKRPFTPAQGALLRRSVAEAQLPRDLRKANVLDPETDRVFRVRRFIPKKFCIVETSEVDHSKDRFAREINEKWIGGHGVLIFGL